MASIQPIDSTSVHRIQSGQVIIDLCSVVKELVENSVDAGATSIEVRFKNHGLEAIEVSDNGSGIASDDYESVALKHYTSKLRSYDDLSNLDTFGFRGEALSSLCALSDVRVTTCQEHETPKGTRLEFESSGKLRERGMVAAGRGTTVTVENIFKNLPVRRQELTRNIKREYAKVLGLLQAYACISTTAKTAVSNVPAKGKKVIAFATKAGQSTRENIANVYGTKTTAALMSLDLEFDMQPTTSVSATQRSKQVRIVGHVSRPTVGEGRQTPDRQMFFVNGRPCVLPQVAKVMNDVYKGFNLTQSPFIFADVRLDTNAYDVNVSPDKRTIMLHEQTELLESLRVSLSELFDNQHQSVPQAKGTYAEGKAARNSLSGTPLTANGIAAVLGETTGNTKLPAFSPLTISKSNQALGSAKDTTLKETELPEVYKSEADDTSAEPREATRPALNSTRTACGGLTTIKDGNWQADLIQKLFTHKVQDRKTPSTKPAVASANDQDAINVPTTTAGAPQAEASEEPLFVEEDFDSSEVPFSEHSSHEGLRKTQADRSHHVSSSQAPQSSTEGFTQTNTSGDQRDGVEQVQSPTSVDLPAEEEPILSIRPSPLKRTPGPVQSAFDRMRPFRTPTQTATITIGNQTTTATIGSSTQNSWTFQQDTTRSKTRSRKLPKQSEKPTLQSSLRMFAAPGTQMRREEGDDIDDSEDETRAAPTTVPLKESRQTRAIASNSTDYEERADSPAESDTGSIESSRGQEESKAAEVSDEGSDGEYLDENAKKVREDARVAKLIREAEERAAQPSGEGLKRAARLLRSGHRASTTRLLLTIDHDTEQVVEQVHKAQGLFPDHQDDAQAPYLSQHEDAPTAEERLSLTVAKEDFGNMRIAGQFNLGFIIALRPAIASTGPTKPLHSNDELFIIDQHASDEKYNFERLQATTIVQNQPLVHKQKLDLTAIEEEIIIENQATLRKNGFEVEIDESGDSPVGQRCTLVRLPMSKEVTFSTRDLEELIALLAENPSLPGQISVPNQHGRSSVAPSVQTSSFLTSVVRPSAVRRMFAMRACRSSVMIGKTLNHKHMKTLVTNMGQMEKPWNCPHGRPTMRHLYSFGQWRGWNEGDGVSGMTDDEDFSELGTGDQSAIDWATWLGSFNSDPEEDGESSTEEASELRDSEDECAEDEPKMEVDED